MAVGARTGRDGIHGASFASEDLSAAERRQAATGAGGRSVHREAAPRGEPRTDRAADTSSRSRTWARRDSRRHPPRWRRAATSGVTIDTSKVPVREEGMTPYEILLSESQERMLVVARKGHEARGARDPREVGPQRCGDRRGDRRAGVSRDRGRSRRRRVPGIAARHRLSDVQSARSRESAEVIALRARDVHAIPERPDERDPVWTLLRLLSSPTIASKRWVYRQYDSDRAHEHRGRPRRRRRGGDAHSRHRSRDRAQDGLQRPLRLPRSASRGRRSPSPRRRATSPAPARGRWRSRTASTSAIRSAPTSSSSSARPSRGMGEACTALGTPVTGGNVSLYNENPRGAVYPTPSIGMVGLIDSTRAHHALGLHDRGRRHRAARRARPTSWAPASISRASTASSPAPPPALRSRTRDGALIDALLEAIRDGAVRSAHDCSDGGLAVALAECCIADADANDRSARST